jgi:flagellar biogenesis protein FliO
VSALLEAGTGPAFYAALQAALALAGVLAVVWLGRRALLQGVLLGRRGEHMKLEERLALDPRNALVIVRVEQRRLLLATGASGVPRLIGELAPSDNDRSHAGTSDHGVSDPQRTSSEREPRS